MKSMGGVFNSLFWGGFLDLETISDLRSRLILGARFFSHYKSMAVVSHVFCVITDSLRMLGTSWGVKNTFFGGPRGVTRRVWCFHRRGQDC